MRASISILLGSIIIFFCYQIIKSELNGAIIKANSKYGYISDENTKEVISNLEGIENTVNELNRSFYEMVSELEGKFSIHDKEIELLSERIDENSKTFETNISKISAKLDESKRSVTKISQNYKEDEKASSKKNKNELSRNNVNLKLQSTSKLEKKADSLCQNTEKEQNIDIISSEGSISSKRIFIESLNEIEKEKLRETIIDLRHKGFSINQIAKKLNVGVGELQLVLNLHRL